MSFTVRSSLRLTLVTLLVAVAALLGAGTAAAHNTLTSSTPADGAALTAGPTDIVLVFDQPVRTFEPTVTVTGPDGTRWEGADIRITDGTVTAAVNPLGPAGTYTVGYRIVSADGHPVTGDLSFTLAEAGTGTPNPVVATDSGSGGFPVWIWIVGAALVVAVIAVLGIRSSRQDRPD